MKKNLIIKIGIVVAICLLIVGVYTVMTKEEAVVSQMEWTQSTLPQVFFEEVGQRVNTLQGYRGDMDITTMRDTITPQDANGNLVFYVEPNGSDIHSISYEVYSIDGSKKLVDGDVEEWSAGEAIEINIKEAAVLSEECILKLTMIIEQTTDALDSEEEQGKYAEKITFYTRTLSYNELYLPDNLALVKTIHDSILSKDKLAVLDYMNLTHSTSKSLQEVSLRSSIDDMLWGTLAPSVVGEIEWNIKECNSISTAILLRYQAEIADPDNGNVSELYNVEEYMRVGYSSSAKGAALIEYNRKANQVLEEGNITLQSRGLKLGITEDVDEMATNEDVEDIAFVQERELWVYDKEENAMSCLFSFADVEEDGMEYDQHDIRIYDVEESGNIAFGVHGYMNSGNHEGYVGCAIYYYDKLQNAIHEVAFIPSNQSYAIGKEVMSSQVYYQGSSNVLYVLSGEAFYKVDLEAGIQELLSEKMILGKYIVADDGSKIVYQSGTEESPELSVLEFSTGKVIRAKGVNGIDMVPLGFSADDLVYGYADKKDELLTDLGETLVPMYTIYIQDENGKNIITYLKEDIFIESIEISSTRIVLNQVVEENGIYVYKGEDYITNNEEEPTSSIYVEAFTDGAKQVQKRLVFTTNMEETSPNMLHPVYVENVEAIQINCEATDRAPMYHVYMQGQLALNTSSVSEAIQLAGDNYGVVTDDSQRYVWMRGNRSLNYSLSNSSELKSQLQSGTTPVQIVINSAQGGVAVYNGCTVEEMCYIINQGKPIAMKLSDGSWNLLVSYTNTTVTYLQSNGNSVTDKMTDLDERIVEMVGSGNV